MIIAKKGESAMGKTIIHLSNSRIFCLPSRFFRVIIRRKGENGMELRDPGAMEPWRMNVRFLSAMRYSPKILKNEIRCRRHSSFLYVVEGEYRYTFGPEEMRVRTDDLVYLPQGAAYQYAVLSEKTETMQCEFDCFLDGQPAALSAHPRAARQAKEGKIALLEMIAVQGGSRSQFVLNAGLFRLLGFFEDTASKGTDAPGLQKIRPALDYMGRHYTEKIPLQDLAEMCFLSQSQFRRLFRREMGKSPLEWKHELLAAGACELLKAPYHSIGEISDALGFENIYAFSRFFKKVRGVSPRTYAREKK